MTPESLVELLRNSVKNRIAGSTRVGVAYSGGVDSSVIAGLAKESATVTCFVCSVEGSFDSKNAWIRAEEDDLTLKAVKLDSSRLSEYTAIAASILETKNPMRIAYTIPLISVFVESDAPVMLAGNGADELFGGYSKYLTSPDPDEMMSDDLEKMLKEVDELQSWARNHKKRLEFPYADERVVSFARHLPLNLKIEGGERKVILRKVAGMIGQRSSERPKKAAQYSSGVLRLMEKCAKDASLSLEKWTERAVTGSCRSPYQRAENLPHQ